MGQVTALLSAIGQGEQKALGELYELLYPELRRLAHSRMRRSGEVTLLDTTSLVHESYLRFEASGAVAVRDRGQFMAYAAKVMRSVVVDEIRRRQSERRGGDAVHVELDEAHDVPVISAHHQPHDNEVLRVHESLEALAAIDARLVQVVQWHIVRFVQLHVHGVTATTLALAAPDFIHHHRAHDLGGIGHELPTVAHGHCA